MCVLASVIFIVSNNLSLSGACYDIVKKIIFIEHIFIIAMGGIGDIA